MKERFYKVQIVERTRTAQDEPVVFEVKNTNENDPLLDLSLYAQGQQQEIMEQFRQDLNSTFNKICAKNVYVCLYGC